MNSTAAGVDKFVHGGDHLGVANGLAPTPGAVSSDQVHDTVCRFIRLGTLLAVRQKGPFVNYHKINVSDDLFPDLGAERFSEKSRAPEKIRHMAYFNLNLFVSDTEKLPGNNNNEPEDHGVYDSNHGIYESGDIVMLAQPDMTNFPSYYPKSPNSGANG